MGEGDEPAGEDREQLPAGVRSTSLLPAGARSVSGNLGEGDTVELRSLDGTVFARGMVYVTAHDLRSVAGRQTRDLPDGMPHEVVHRDDLVILT